MEFQGEEVKTSPLKFPPHIRCELEKNLVLCYTGKSRLSGNIHQNVTDAYKSGEPSVRDALETLKATAEATKTALMRGRLTEFGELLTQNWQNQKKLHSSVTNEQIESLFKIAMTHGAIGRKSVWCWWRWVSPVLLRNLHVNTALSAKNFKKRARWSLM